MYIYIYIAKRCWFTVCCLKSDHTKFLSPNSADKAAALFSETYYFIG